MTKRNGKQQPAGSTAPPTRSATHPLSAFVTRMTAGLSPSERAAGAKRVEKLEAEAKQRLASTPGRTVLIVPPSRSKE